MIPFFIWAGDTLPDTGLWLVSYSSNLVSAAEHPDTHLLDGRCNKFYS
jgi:hypothetical protein